MTPAPRIPNLSTYSGRFGARLRELRAKAGLSQAEFAEAMQVQQSTISRWELGERFPPADALPAIAKVLRLENTVDLFPHN